jgi:hypothetical protein
MISFSDESGRTVAWRSKRCPGKNRAITGAARPFEKSSLGGVSLVMVGAESAHWTAIKVNVKIKIFG